MDAFRGLHTDPLNPMPLWPATHPLYKENYGWLGL